MGIRVYVETGLVNSISFGEGECRTPTRSVCFNGKPIKSGRTIVENTISIKESDFEKFMLFDFKAKNMEKDCKSNVLDLRNVKHEAAIKLQKVYKSFRTRRKLADCAVLVEQSWWKLLDFAELKRSSISFFDVEKQETVISRWSRARTKATKLGKGLSENAKGQKLALQHWLEAIDPRHRYGHNLRFYYNKWLQCHSRQPFFYWLDIGEGKEVNLVEKCPRLKLQQQRVKYLGPMERKAYEVVIEEGKFYYKNTGELLETASEEIGAKWIFVLSISKNLYIGKKKKGTFQHSSFLAGGAAVAAGRLVIENGVLKAVWPHSGHYQPTEENFKDLISFLQENKVDLSDVKMNSTDENEFSNHKLGSTYKRTLTLEEDFAETENSCVVQDTIDSIVVEETNGGLLTNLEKPKRKECFQMLQCENLNREANSNKISDGYESEEEEEDVDGEISNLEQEPGARMQNRVEEETEESEIGKISEECILKRINSKIETGSFQLGQQLSGKWTTGAGPRISCVRDYPLELQVQALVQVSLSYFSPRPQISSKLCRETSMNVDSTDRS